ncbi:MAG TPA: hypothetical protein VFH72_09955, partial [Candidatus Baltobacteraceae bacterium]|nr:hypothetical protein [Candidatus Baltobacteraceae bacterium]
AVLHYARVGSDTSLIRQQSSRDSDGKATTETSSLFGFELTALGPRTLPATRLAFDTSGGWYTLDVPALTLAAKERHYSAPWVKFIRRDYVSPVLYVHFPQAVTIAHAWVYQATAQDDGAFGWQAKGSILCDPMPSASPEQRRRLPAHFQSPYALDSNDADHLADPPSSTSIILDAANSKPLETTKCAEPFRNATIKDQAQPSFPDFLRDEVVNETMTAAQVAIEPSGTLEDAWVWGTSGYRALDDETLKVARISTYEGARAYCRAVPGEYFFRVTFDPNG